MFPDGHKNPAHFPASQTWCKQHRTVLPPSAALTIRSNPTLPPSMTRSTKTIGKERRGFHRNHVAIPCPTGIRGPGTAMGRSGTPLKAMELPASQTVCTGTSQRSYILRWCRTTVTSFLFKNMIVDFAINCSACKPLQSAASKNLVRLVMLVV